MIQSWTTLMAFPIASRRSVSFPRGTRVTYVTWNVIQAYFTCYRIDKNCGSTLSQTMRIQLIEELRQFWRQKGVQPGSSKVYLINWPVSVCMCIYIYICVCVYVCVCVYIYTHVYAERKKSIKCSTCTGCVLYNAMTHSHVIVFVYPFIN